jgi:hypothetical protein
MSEELLPSVPGQRHVQVSVTMQTGGCISLSMETLVILGLGETDSTAKLRCATQQLLDSIPVKDVERVEMSVAPDEDDDVVTKEPHPLFVKLVGELSKLNKTMEKHAGGSV